MLMSFYVIMLLMGFCLMLLVMTFNVGILFTLCAGVLVGHFIFESIGHLELPLQYKQIAGSGAYLPEPDNCCCKVQQSCLQERPSSHQGYAAAQVGANQEY